MSKSVILGGAVGILLTAAVAVVALTAVFGDLAVADEKKEGEEKFTTTKSGLKYVDQKVGDGAEAKAGSKVKVHYTGTLENGKKFDSSLDRNEPFGLTLGAGMVIKGWDEGLQGMKVGGKRKLVIPPELGYGERGTPGGPIPGNATLIFVVEMLEVK
jgi:FKBP-type peptidyl-prolyl cis-trans isomerase